MSLADDSHTEAEVSALRADPSVQRRLLGDAIDQAAVLMFVADEEGGYVAVNDYACKVLGYSREELLSMSVPEIAVDPEAPALYQTMVEQRGATGLTPIRCKDGRLLRLRYWASPLSVARTELWASVGVIEAASESGVVSKEKAGAAEHVPAAGGAPKPKLVFFYSERSGRSRRAEGFLAQILQRRQNHETFELIRVSVERKPELAARFKVTELPTICIVEGRRLRKRIVDPRGGRELEAELAEWLR